MCLLTHAGYAPGANDMNGKNGEPPLRLLRRGSSALSLTQRDAEIDEKMRVKSITQLLAWHNDQ